MISCKELGTVIRHKEPYFLIKNETIHWNWNGESYLCHGNIETVYSGEGSSYPIRGSKNIPPEPTKYHSIEYKYAFVHMLNEGCTNDFIPFNYSIRAPAYFQIIAWASSGEYFPRGEIFYFSSWEDSEHVFNGFVTKPKELEAYKKFGPG